MINKRNITILMGLLCVSLGVNAMEIEDTKVLAAKIANKALGRIEYLESIADKVQGNYQPLISEEALERAKGTLSRSASEGSIKAAKQFKLIAAGINQKFEHGDKEIQEVKHSLEELKKTYLMPEVRNHHQQLLQNSIVGTQDNMTTALNNEFRTLDGWYQGMLKKIGPSESLPKKITVESLVEFADKFKK